MTRPGDPDIAALYHLHSSNFRERPIDTVLDHDRAPRRMRTYPGSPRFPLPGRDFAMDAPLGAVLEGRRSIREYDLDVLDPAALGRLLHAGNGLRGYRRLEGEWTFDRPSPSAGGLYPIELYVAVQQVGGLGDGVYHYDPRAHELELRNPGAHHVALADMTIEQPMIESANVVVAITAVFERTMWKYGQRGYRYVWLEAGHVAENLYLAAHALGLGPAAIGGFFDAEVDELLRLPADERTIYLLCVGQPAAAGRLSGST